ncbi:MAG: hypothetical protein M0R30_12040 [Methanoregula sp.]|uniref:DUF6790 family protein n=1 Tax=Methanoregula sp. TaxID=2052170 RepID=UPI002600161F|nr:DUF6790 family protein [Methanoregula sp.]MCK9632353.1 hypothetical protein [Methanoregula sp.]
MAAVQPTAHEASLLMGATMTVSMIGIFIGIFYLFIDIDIAIRITAAVLVGLVGIISFIRHSVFYQSDQVRMGWRQDHPEFQLEVGYANLAFGIWALVAAALNWVLVCGVMLAIYATYLLCALLLHLHEAHARDDLHIPAHRSRAMKSVVSTGFFVLALFLFAVVAFARAGVLPFVQL